MLFKDFCFGRVVAGGAELHRLVHMGAIKVNGRVVVFEEIETLEVQDGDYITKGHKQSYLVGDKMKKTEALGLQTQLENDIKRELEKKGETYEVNLSQALTGDIQVHFDEYFVNFHPETLIIRYIHFTGYWEDFMTLTKTAHDVLEAHPILLTRLMWSYEHKSELIDDVEGKW